MLFRALRESGARLAKREVVDRPVITSWQKLIDYCHASLAHEKTERFNILFLDRKNVLIADETQQKGTVDHTPVYPREVAKRACSSTPRRSSWCTTILPAIPRPRAPTSR